MKKVVTFGEIMLRLAPPGYLRFSQANQFDVIYGGGESNVAVSLANYNLPVEFVTRLPDNDIGHCALMEMRKRNVGTQNVVFGGDRLGIYFLETGAISRGSKVYMTEQILLCLKLNQEWLIGMKFLKTLNGFTGRVLHRLFLKVLLTLV